MVEGLRRVIAGRTFRTATRPLAGLVLAIVLFGAPRSGAALEPTPAAIQEARDRFARGRALEDQGRWSQALAEFRRVASVKMTPQVRFHIALCLENTGSLTRALDGFALAAREADAMPEEIRDPQVIIESREHIEALKRRIPTLTLSVSDLQVGDELRIDGTTIAPALASLALRVDPGVHVIELRRRGRVVAREVVRISEASVSPVALVVGNIDPDPFHRLQTSEAPSETPNPNSQAVHRDASGANSALRYVAFASFAAATASTVAAVGFARARQRALNDVRAECPTLKDCDPSVAPDVERGRSHTTFVNVFGAVSIATVATGVVTMVLAGTPGHPPLERSKQSNAERKRGPRAAVRVRGGGDANGAALMLVGAF